MEKMVDPICESISSGFYKGKKVFVAGHTGLKGLGYVKFLPCWEQMLQDIH